MTLTLRDELIMAYADGELDPPLADCVREAVASDPAIRSRHAVYADTRQALARAFDDVLNEPLPARLTKSLRHTR